MRVLSVDNRSPVTDVHQHADKTGHAQGGREGRRSVTLTCTRTFALTFTVFSTLSCRAAGSGGACDPPSTHLDRHPDAANSLKHDEHAALPPAYLLMEVKVKVKAKVVGEGERGGGVEGEGGGDGES